MYDSVQELNEILRMKGDGGVRHTPQFELFLFSYFLNYCTVVQFLTSISDSLAGSRFLRVPLAEDPITH